MAYSMFRSIVLLLRLFIIFHVHALCESSTAFRICDSLGEHFSCKGRELSALPEIPDWAGFLELNQNDLTKLDAEDFIRLNLTRLKELDLSQNRISDITPGLFSLMPELQKLKLDKNALKEIPFLGRCPKLRELSISSNEILWLNGTILSYLPSLEILDLSYNSITDIPLDAFPRGNRIKRLYLNNNEISSIESGGLDNLTSLVEFRLNRNKINALQKNLFANLSQLETLDLNRNELQEIPGLGFHGLKSLQQLKLRKNRIRELSDGAFWELPDLRSLYLDNNSISEVRQGWLYGLTSLRLLSASNNAISSLQQNCWEFSENLQDINLDSNQLESLPHWSFEKLPRLTTLRLNQNRISFIEDGTFASLSKLNVLLLNDNQASALIEDSSGAFRGLFGLGTLSLANNGITSISAASLQSLRGLRKLDLAGNDITSVEFNAFEQMKHLADLMLDSKALICDCQLQWLAFWVVDTGLARTVEAKCQIPKAVSGHRFVTLLPEDNFNCSDEVYRPIIATHPESEVVGIAGGDANLSCTSVTSFAEEFTVTWIKGHEKVDPDNVDLEKRVVQNSKIELTSTLHLRNLTRGDSELYRCIVQNQFGRSYSQRGNLSVLEFPRFTSAPADLELEAGARATFSCSAEGYPEPVISWTKAGGDFPAARERRIHNARDNEQEFVIINLKVNDSGAYTCKASNQAGVVKANATLLVLEPPSLPETMADREVGPGETAIFQCLLGGGNPPPKVTWFKDGSLIQVGARTLTPLDGQILLVLRVNTSDAGDYTCEASNTAGTATRSAKLIVQTADARWSGGDESEITTIKVIIIISSAFAVIVILIWAVVVCRASVKYSALCCSGRTGQPPSSVLLPRRFQGADEELSSMGQGFVVRSNPLGGLDSGGEGRVDEEEDEVNDDEIEDGRRALLRANGEYPTSKDIEALKALTRTTVLDDASEHSSGKDSGTGSGTERSPGAVGESITILDVLGTGDRRSLVIQSVPADDRKRIRCSSGGEVGSQFSVSTSDAGSFLDCAAPLVDTSGRWCGVGDKDIPRGASPVHHTLRRKRMAKGREIKCPSIPALNMTDSAPDPRL